MGGDKKLAELIRLIKQGKSRIWIPLVISLMVRELDTGKGVLKMAKTGENLKGIRFITADGDKISLDKYIKDKQVVEDVQHLYQQEISERQRSRGRIINKGNLPTKEGVSKRVRRFTKEEIRKEYGMKEAPHSKAEGGLRADCLWLIRNNSPITAARAAEVLDKNKSSISGIFSNVFKILGGDFIERTDTLPYEYRPLHHYDVKVAYKELCKRERQLSKEKRAKAKGEEPEPPAEPEKEPEFFFTDEDHRNNYNWLVQRYNQLEKATLDSLKDLAKSVEINNERIITLARTQQELLEAGVGQGGVQTLRIEIVFGWKS